MTIVMGLKPQGREVLRISVDGDDPTWPECAGTINLQIILIRPRDSYLNRATKKILAKVFYPKRSRNRKVAESRVWLLAGYNKLESVPWDWSSSSVKPLAWKMFRWQGKLVYYIVPDSGDPGKSVLLADFTIREIFACGIRIPGLWNPLFNSRNLEPY